MRMGKWGLVVGMTAALAACGGGGSGAGGTGGGDGPDAGVVRALTLRGVAATGAAVSSGTVRVRCKTGTATAATAVDGSFTLTLPGGEQPCILQVTDPVTSASMYSLAEPGAAVANVTPLTTLVVATALGEAPSLAFLNFDASAQARVTAEGVAAAAGRVKAGIAALGADADLGDIDVMKGPLVPATHQAVGDIHDRKIDALMTALAAADQRIGDLEAKFRTVSTDAEATAKVLSVVGDARYAMDQCPFARSGNMWMLNFTGMEPLMVNINFNTRWMTIDAAEWAAPIEAARDAEGRDMPCAFTATSSGYKLEFHISRDGVGVWRGDSADGSDFGLSVPVQTRWQLSDSAMRGAYASLGFVMEKRYRISRFATAARFDIDSAGKMVAHKCDMSEDLPVCSESIDVVSASAASGCTKRDGGLFSCVDSSGATSVVVPYVSGSQVALFMVITQMTVSGVDLTGLAVLTKSPGWTLPAPGRVTPPGTTWLAGYPTGSYTVMSKASDGFTVDSVDVPGNSFVTTPQGSKPPLTHHVDSPAPGFMLSRQDGSSSLAIGSPSGWSVAATRGKGPFYDGWSAAVGVPR